MSIEIVSTIVNTILLLILFFYQRNKNKVLLDRIYQQEKVLNETKSIVSQQSTAIESQSRVVDTALKYSEVFDPKKIEAIIRKEMEIDHKAELAKLRSENENQKFGPAIDDETKEKLSADLNKFLSDLFSELALPAFETLIKLLYTLPLKERNNILNEIPPGNGKDLLMNIIEKVDEKISQEGLGPNKLFQQTAKRCR